MDKELKYGECIHHENLAMCSICNKILNPKIQTPTINTLLDLLAEHGGKIVSTASLTTEWINQARASGRMFVDENSLGFVWEPDIKRIPQTEDEVVWFEKWYPLHAPVPEDINTWDKVQKRAKRLKRSKDY
jgi:hypothetical protein